MTVKPKLIAAVAAVAVAGTFATAASAQVTTSGLTYNFDTKPASVIADWQSTAPGSNTTAVLDTGRDTGAGAAAADAVLTNVTTGRTFTQAYRFDRTPNAGNAEARLDIDPSSGVAFVDSFAGLSPAASFEVWARPTSLTNPGGLGQILFETGGTGKGLTLAINNSRLYVIAKSSGVANNDANLVASVPLTSADVTDFAQFVLTLSATGTPALYVNGVARTLTTDATGFNGDFAGGNVAALSALDQGGFGGTDGDGGGLAIDDATAYSGLVGDIAIFRAYDDALTGAQVTANFNAVVPEPSTLGLLGVAGLGLLRRRRA